MLSAEQLKCTKIFTKNTTTSKDRKASNSGQNKNENENLKNSMEMMIPKMDSREMDDLEVATLA